jgi:iron complex outermembrane receptor protein
MPGGGTCRRSQPADHGDTAGRRAILPRNHVSLTAASLLAALDPVAPCALAEDAELEQILVTGSRIARPDFDSASPIVSVPEDFFRRSGSRTVESQLNTLPQFVPAYTSTSNNPGATGGNGGQANLSLRGLGTTSTLVLVDGKRLIPANGTGVVDLNIIPSSLIESVEIITGGASAVYGSDALAGVVNLKLKREFDGFQIDGSWGQTDRGDGTQYEAGLTAGTEFAGGRGSVVSFVGYADRELITQGERDFSKYALFYTGPGNGTLGPGNAFLPGGSRTIEEGRVLFPINNLPSEEAFEDLMQSYGYTAGDAAGQVPYQNLFGFNTDGTLFTQGDEGYVGTQVIGVANFRGVRDPVTFNDFVYSYNFAPPNALQMPLERKSAFARADFELSDSARVYAQALYSDYTVGQQLAPAAFFSPLFIPVGNPYVPDDLSSLLESRPGPLEDIGLVKRLSEAGPRISHNNYDVYQLTLGLSDTVFDDWEYDVYAQVGANDQEYRLTGNVLLSRAEELTFAPDGGASICGGFNPFGLDSISPECLDYISVAASNHASVDQAIAEASLSGPLLELPAGELRAAFGVFYKEDKYQYVSSQVASVFLPDGRPDIQGFDASDDIQGDDHNVDVWGEVLVPLLRGIPGASSLEAVLGYRLSDYASAGSFDSWKAELLYQPIEPIRLRGSYQQAIRAASVYELYLPQLPTFQDFFSFEEGVEQEGGVEPCDATSAARNGADAARVEALCIEQGVPAALMPTFFDSDGEMSGVTGGNPDLGPEEATTSTLGVVWTPRFAHALVSNLQISLDWYRIEVTDKIWQIYPSQYVQYCYDARYNPDFSLSNQWCTMFARDLATGEIEDIRDINWNAIDWETNGLDMQVDWRFDLGPGQVGVSWFVSWLDSWTESVVDSSAPSTEYSGTVGGFNIGFSLPEWKSNLHLSYAWRDVTLGAGWRYIGGMTDVFEPEFQVPSVDYFSIDASYEFSSGPLEGLSFVLGVENLTDEDPPILASPAEANTDPSQYDVFGRSYFVSLRYAF